MLNKLKTILWFIKKPQYIPQIFQVLKRKKNNHLENTRNEATEWCKKHCISQHKALELLIGNKPYKELKDLYPNDIKIAEKIAKSR